MPGTPAPRPSPAAAQQQSQAITDTFTDLKAGAKNAAAESVQAVTSPQNALDQISAAKTTEQLTALQGEMPQGLPGRHAEPAESMRTAPVSSTRS
ncbi:hypothetical protein AAHB60_31850 [Pseudomonas aeruginosa]